MQPILHHHFPAGSIPLGDGQDYVPNLGEQVTAIAERLSLLSRLVEKVGNIPAVVDAKMLQRMLEARRARARFLPDGLFADPAWDILLDLLMTQLDGQRVTVGNLCIASNVPPTTALRWIKVLEVKGLVNRHVDPLDSRRFFIELTKKAELALSNYFAAIDLDMVI